MLIKMNSGYFALVDASDFTLVNGYTWSVARNKNTIYARTKGNFNGRKKMMLMHVLIMGRTGVDHKNKNGLDNRRLNLRFATASQNAANQNKRIGAYSKYRGVTWHVRIKKWYAQIRVNGKSNSLGYFPSEFDAASAYNNAAKYFFGEFATLNIGIK